VDGLRARRILRDHVEQFQPSGCSSRSNGESSASVKGEAPPPKDAPLGPTIGAPLSLFGGAAYAPVAARATGGGPASADGFTGNTYPSWRDSGRVYAFTSAGLNAHGANRPPRIRCALSSRNGWSSHRSVHAVAVAEISARRVRARAMPFVVFHHREWVRLARH
jgi:hypothetical protein